MARPKNYYLKLSKPLYLSLFFVGLISCVSVNFLPIALFIFGSIAFYAIQKNKMAWRPRNTNSILAIAIFFFYLLVSSLWSPDTSRSLFQSVQFIFIFVPTVFILLYISYLDTPEREKIGKAIRYGFALALFFLIFEVILDQPIYHFWLEHIATDRKFDPNHLERSISIFSLFYFILAAHIAKRTNKLIALTVIISWIWFCYEFSFPAQIIATSTGLFCLLIALWSEKITRFLIFLGLTAYIIFSVPLSILNYETNFLKNTISSEVISESFIEQRSTTYFNVSNKIIQKPFFGHGLDSAALLSHPENYENQENPSGFSLHPHNFILQILFEGGYVGGALFIMVILSFMNRIHYNNVTTNTFLLGALSTNLTIASFSYGIWQSWWLAAFAFIIISFNTELLGKNSTIKVREKKLRIMHAIFSHGYRGSESALALIANAQVKHNPVSVMVRADCDARDGPSIIEALDPKIHIIRVPNLFRSLWANIYILIWQPDVLHSHLGRAVRFKSWFKPNLLRVSSMHIFSPHHHTGQDRIICISDWMMNHMPEKLKLKSRLVRNATPPSPALSEKEKSDLRQKWGIAPDKRIFGFVGAVNKTKGADIAIDAFCQANPENAHLLMIGEGPLRQSLEDKTSHIENITFAGYQDNARDYMQIIDILILPSNWAEPFMLSLLEGMQAGCWVITINQYGPGDIMRGQPNGATAALGNIDAFAEAIKNAPTQTSQRYEYHLEKFNFDYHIASMYKIYQDSSSPLFYSIQNHHYLR